LNKRRIAARRNLSRIANPAEKRVYFETSGFATNYAFFESPG
jgi:hypothetical protein